MCEPEPILEDSCLLYLQRELRCDVENGQPANQGSVREGSTRRYPKEGAQSFRMYSRRSSERIMTVWFDE